MNHTEFTNQNKDTDIPINTRQFKKNGVIAVPYQVFSIIILNSGSITAQIKGENHDIMSPAMICLDESARMLTLNGCYSHAKIINFDPTLVDSALSISSMRAKSFKNVCHRHALLQLAPFLSNNVEKCVFRLSDDLLSQFDINFYLIEQNLNSKGDWYWPYRVHSYFMSTIFVIEQIYYDFFNNEISYSHIPDELTVLKEYINNHLDEKITLDSLYARFRINKNRIENMFKEYYGVTFYEYIKKRRFEAACSYLRTTELDGELIASRIGLSSSQNFCKFFRSMCGCSPNSYRKKSRQ